MKFERSEVLLEHLIKIRNNNLLLLRDDYKQVLKSSHKFTEEEAEIWLSNKDISHCEICNRPKRLVVDHDHKTEKVRGLLCMGCNTSLGKFQEDPQIILNALNYLVKNLNLEVEIKIKEKIQVPISGSENLYN